MVIVTTPPSAENISTLGGSSDRMLTARSARDLLLSRAIGCPRLSAQAVRGLTPNLASGPVAVRLVDALAPVVLAIATPSRLLGVGMGLSGRVRRRVRRGVRGPGGDVLRSAAAGLAHADHPLVRAAGIPAVRRVTSRACPS